MKKSTVMKSAVMTPEMRDAGSALAPGRKTIMSIDQIRMGRVSRRERRMPRGAGRANGRIRASVTIGLFPPQHGDSHREVIEGNEHHRHARNSNDGLVADDATQTQERNKPDRSSQKEYCKEKQGGVHAAQLSCP